MTLSQDIRPTGTPGGRSRWDAIVVGCGVMGSSVTYNLARKGMKVLNIERFGVNHDRGSSHGKTRIIRLAYYEDPRYVPLLRRAFDSWREVESKSGKKLMLLTGGLMIGRPEGELVRGVLASARVHDIPHEVMTSKEATSRFPAFELGEEFFAVFERNAGVLFAEECIRAFVGLGSEAGAEFRFSERVTDWRSSRDGVEVETSLGRQSASKLVLCAGAWNAQLLKGKAALTCERQVPFWFDSRGKGKFGPAQMPIFIMEDERREYYYGIPDVGHGVKVARTHGGEFGDPDGIRREVSEEDRAPVNSFVARRMSGLGPLLASDICLYTNTPDLHFAVGQHPEEPKVTLVSACSGHGFKFASVIGEVATRMVADEREEYDLSFLDPARLWR